MHSSLLYQMDSEFTCQGPWAVLRNGKWCFEMISKAILPLYVSITHNVDIKQVT